MKGVRCSRRTYEAPAVTNTSSTATFITTSAVLVLADSRMPMHSSAATSSTMQAAGRLNSPCVTPPPGSASTTSGAAVSRTGRRTPRSPRKLTKYPDHPTATVLAESAYSRIRSHPMIQAKISPAVA